MVLTYGVVVHLLARSWCGLTAGPWPSEGKVRMSTAVTRNRRRVACVSRGKAGTGPDTGRGLALQPSLGLLVRAEHMCSETIIETHRMGP